MQLFDELQRVKLRSIAGGDAQQEDLGLSNAETVTLQAAGKDLLLLRLGEERKNGGRYIAFGPDPKAYVSSEPLRISPDGDQWEVKTLVKIPADQIKTIAFTPAAKAPVTLTRDKKEDPPKVLNLAAGAKESPQVGGASSGFGSVMYTKRYEAANDEAKAALASPSHVTVTTFDGTEYTLDVGSIGDKNKKWFLAVHGKKVDPIIATFSYEVPAYTAEAFAKGMDDFTQGQG